MGHRRGCTGGLYVGRKIQMEGVVGSGGRGGSGGGDGSGGSGRTGGSCARSGTSMN